MPKSNYSPKQEKALGSVREIVDQLIDLESLQKRAYQSVLSLDNTLDQTIADISLG